MKPEISTTVLILFVLSVTKVTTAQMGVAYNLTSEDIYGPVNVSQNGYLVFTFDPRCLLYTNGTMIDNRASFHDDDSFFSRLSSESGLPATLKGYYTMGETLRIKSDGISSNDTSTIRGTSINIIMEVNTSRIDHHCFNGSRITLAPEFVKSFDALPNVTDPSMSENWKAYDDFLKRHGSHVVTGVTYGSLLRWWSSTETFRNYTEQMIDIKSCVDFAGTADVRQMSAAVCRNISQPEADHFANLTGVTQHLEIRGGTPETRANLTRFRSSENIHRLLQEGQMFPAPIKFKYVSIWDILIMYFKYDSRRYPKAMNLKQYYEGYKDFECTLLQSMDLMSLRQFRFSRYSTPSIPLYECILTADGCRKDTDCHADGSVTYCYGESCVQHVNPTKKSKSKRSQIRYSRIGSHSEDVNQSCFLSSNTARCNVTWGQNETIWYGKDSYDAMSVYMDTSRPDFEAIAQKNAEHLEKEEL